VKTCDELFNNVLFFFIPLIKAREHGKQVVQKLSELIPRQQYEVKIQAVVNSKILARGNIKPVRKDVTAKCYGGDLSRQMKLLKYQAEGKKRMKMVGKVQLSQDVFRKLLSWQVLFSQYLFGPTISKLIDLTAFGADYAEW
jgi:translation elongation factor EF-4